MKTSGASLTLSMVAAIALGAVLLAAPQSARAEVNGDVYQLVNDGKILVALTSTGSQKSIRVHIINPNAEKYKVLFPYGTIFWAGDTKYQNLALVVNNEISVPPNTAGNVIIDTACMNAGRAVAKEGYSDWTVRYDAGMANLLTFFYSGQAMFGAVIKPDFIDTKKKKRDFLQGIVWVYCDATKKQMRKFARKYMFSSKEEADTWVDLMYPLAKQFIDLYKVMHGSKTLK